MARPLQQASVRRKMYYFALVAILFTVSIFWRGVIDLPLSGRVGDWFSDQTIVSQAQDLELRTLDQGEADLTGETVKLLLTGSRGLATCALWVSAMEKKKKHEWNELEIIVDSLTKLQPHFLTPWLFQSWNLAYNVSVEADQLNDAYFYIAKGIRLLAEGERLNRNNPDMRYSIAFYFQNKFGVSDKVDTFRSLFQLSCIPPDDRNPRRFRDGDKINIQEFRNFCEEHPILVRRLRESKLNYQTPEQVIKFLGDNFKIPSRYQDGQTLAERLDQFPVLPPDFSQPFPNVNELRANQPADDAYDGFLAARAWFQYSLLPVPEPSGKPQATPSPEDLPPGKRIPRKPMLIIFRHGAPRAQSYYADRLEKDGWYGEEGWEIDRAKTGSDRWFDETVVVGSGTEWSRINWEQAYEMWSSHGEANGLLLSAEEIERYQRRAMLLEKLGIAPLQGITPQIRPDQAEDPVLKDAFEAHRRLMYYRQNLSVTNFEYHLNEAEAEMDPVTIEARRLFAEAKRYYRELADQRSAIETYRKAFDLWKQVLVNHPAYHRAGSTQRAQEDAFEEQLRYARLLQDRMGEALPNSLLTLLHHGMAVTALTSGAPLHAVEMAKVAEAVTGDQSTYMPYLHSLGPLDGDAPDGQPWIEDSVRYTIGMRYGVELPQTQDALPPPEANE